MLHEDVNAVLVEAANQFCDVEGKHPKDARRCRMKFKGFLREIFRMLHVATIAAATALSRSICEVCVVDSLNTALLVQ